MAWVRKNKKGEPVELIGSIGTGRTRQYIREPIPRGAAAREVDQQKRSFESAIFRGEITGKVQIGQHSLTAKSSLADVLDRWIEHKAVYRRKRTGNPVTSNTLRQYRSCAELYIKPLIGHIAVGKVRPIHVDNFLSQMYERKHQPKKKGETTTARSLSPTTVRSAFITLHGCLRQAKRWKLIVHDPTEDVERPEARPKPGRALSPTEAGRLLAVSRGTDLELLVLLGLYAGLRRQEVLGLQVGDIDFERGEISILRAVEAVTDDTAGPFDAKIVGRLKDPKSDASRRRVPVGADVMEALRQHIARLGASSKVIPLRGRDERLLISAEDGAPINPNSIYGSWRGIAEKADIGHVRPHDLRHTYGSWLLRNGVPIATVSALLGHSNIGVTITVYAHELAEDRRGVADVIGKTLRQAQRLPG